MMFKLEQIGETHTDETTNFKVVLDKPYTVSSFIDTVLKNTSDWGYIGLILLAKSGILRQETNVEVHLLTFFIP